MGTLTGIGAGIGFGGALSPLSKLVALARSLGGNVWAPTQGNYSDYVGTVKANAPDNSIAYASDLAGSYPARQATTANDPVLRGGVQNFQTLTRGSDFGIWTKRGTGANILPGNTDILDRFGASGKVCKVPQGTLGASGINDVYANTTSGPFAALSVTPVIWIYPASASGNLSWGNPAAASSGLITINIAALAQNAWNRVTPTHAACTVVNAFAFKASNGLAGNWFNSTGGITGTIYLDCAGIYLGSDPGAANETYSSGATTNSSAAVSPYWWQLNGSSQHFNTGIPTPASGYFVCAGELMGGTAAAKTLFGSVDSSSLNGIHIYRATSGHLLLDMADGANSTAIDTGVSIADGAPFVLSCSWSNGAQKMKVTVGGVTNTYTGTTAKTVTSANTANIGKKGAAAVYGQGYIGPCEFIPSVPSAAQDLAIRQNIAKLAGNIPGVS